jgi:predicted nucleic acid-binding protein
MIVVLDASAATEYLLRTDLGEIVAGVLENAQPTAPELLDAEVLSVLRREVHKGHLTARRAEQALSDLTSWDLVRVPHRPLLAMAWSLRGHVSAYDALYVSAARALGATLVTADGPLSRATHLQVPIHNIRLA